LKKLKFPLAPLPEQRAIVSKIELLFSELDNAVSNLKQAKDKLEIFRQSVLKKAFEGELTKEWRGKKGIKAKWESVNVEKLCSHIVDCLHSTPKFISNGKFCVDTTCISDSQIIWDRMRYVDTNTYEDRIRRLKPQQGDIFFAREGTVGTTVVLNQNIDICLGQRMMMFRLLENVNSKYFMYYFISDSFKKQYKPLIGGTTSPHLNIRDIKKFYVPICSLHEQIQIVQEIETRFSVADKLAESIDESLLKAEALRQSILKKAFEGELLSKSELDACRKESDWEPAEKLLERIKKERK
jgi:type I restriction enzyme S subunit